MTNDSEKLVALYFYYTNEPMSARRWMQIIVDGIVWKKK